MKLRHYSLLVVAILVLPGCEGKINKPADYSPPPRHVPQNSNPSVLAGKMISPVM
jgi:hypothetical protein